jgi:hypothetical protein
MTPAENTAFGNKINEATITFVREHREEDVRALALSGCKDSSVDLTWALNQIQGWQTARKKLPSWAAIDGIIYPPHLSMEQCSSETTALYKCSIIERLPEADRGLLVDLTGGFGVDFSFMSPHFGQAVYVERQPYLVETAQHNFELLHKGHKPNSVLFINEEADKAIGNSLPGCLPVSTLFFLDPARRDDKQARTYAIADCSPNVLELLPRLFQHGHRVLLKLSPMLDWHKVVSDLGSHVAEVHIVSVKNECKELLVLLDIMHEGEPTVYCVNDSQTFIYTPSQDVVSPMVASSSEEAVYLYEPNASVMKAGCYGLLTQRYPVTAVATDSHLFVSRERIDAFPGRCFAVTAVTTMNKKELATALKGITQANVTTRNFPMSSQQLRKRLRLGDGGDCYIFGTTTAAGEHLIYICKKEII